MWTLQPSSCSKYQSRRFPQHANWCPLVFLHLPFFPSTHKASKRHIPPVSHASGPRTAYRLNPRGRLLKHNWLWVVVLASHPFTLLLIYSFCFSKPADVLRLRETWSARARKIRIRECENALWRKTLVLEGLITIYIWLFRTIRSFLEHCDIYMTIEHISASSNSTVMCSDEYFAFFFFFSPYWYISYD